MRYAVVIERYEQCSPDDFDKMRYIKEINNETTIEDLIEWQKKLFPKDVTLKEGTRINEMLIQMME